MTSGKKRYDPPRHQWTEKQTYHLLETISSSQTYLDTFFPPQLFKSTSTKYELEKELCLLILDDTKWMEWMIQHSKIRRNGDRLEVLEGWEKMGNPVRSRLDLIHKDARDARRLLGKATSPDDLEHNSQERLIWNDYRNSGRYTWYFLYVQAQLVHNPNWINSPQTTGDSRSGSSSTPDPGLASSATPLRSISTNHPRDTEARRSTRGNCPDERPISSNQRTTSSLPRPSLSNVSPSTPVRPLISSFPRSANTTTKRTLPPHSTTFTTPSSSSSPRLAPLSLDSRLSKRPRVSPPAQRISLRTTPLIRRVGNLAPDVISISSDSDSDSNDDPNGSFSNNEDEDNDDSTDLVEIQVTTMIRPDPSSNIPFIPFSTNRDNPHTRSRTILDQAQNLEAIRNLSRPIMTPRNHDDSDDDSDSDREEQDETTEVSSRPPTPPFPPPLSSTTSAMMTHIEELQGENTLSGAISEHFMEDMFHDPTIRSYRLDALHRNLGKSPPPVQLAVQSIVTVSAGPVEDDEVLRLHAVEHQDEEEEFRYGLVFSPLIITDGTLPDFPIDLGSPKHGERDKPIEISDTEDDEEQDQVVIVQQSDISRSSISILEIDTRPSVNHHPGGGEVEELVDEHEDTDMDMDMGMDVQNDADLDDLNSELGVGARDELEDMDLCSDMGQDDIEQRVDDSWEMVDDPGSCNSPQHRPPSLTIASSSTQPMDPLNKSSPSSRSLAHTQPGSTQDTPRTLDAFRPMIRILLLELKHTKSRALVDIEVDFRCMRSPSIKSLEDIVELMGGKVFDANRKQGERKMRYLVVDHGVLEEDVHVSKGRTVTVGELLGVIADLRERELNGV
ncbi:hypothetical protein I203_105146 [Kwoniella mangroviensis CBS 8507]|uniref:uncharacterized protein n=1 Tax=Kwoniella mangroviensis CBS 8507 TaxID=1296122 RepID=UPI00080D1B27|nr:uncharacterized protein I203_00970 [Kwoniella mangroviensis CBS 8507]OCF69118.1 hypothetical protein I203_00970 [Kwoniella mangroviensis CBS 8507]